MRLRIFGLLALAMPLIGLTPGAQRALAAAPGQKTSASAGNAPAVLDNATIGQFDSVFRAISASAQVTIVAEGVPLQQALTPDEASALSSSVSGPDVKLDEEVSLIALAYDYDAERISQHCFLLHKRHSDPDDLPDVTYAEIVHSLQAVIGTIDLILPAPSDTSQGSSVFDLYDLLTSEQLARAHDGIALSELDPTQRKLALSTATQCAGRMQTSQLGAALEQLLALQDDRTVFTCTSKSDSPQFGLEGPFGPAGVTGKFPLNTSYKSPIEWHGFPDRTPGKPVDSARPTDEDRRRAPGMLSNRLPSTLALGEFAQLIGGQGESGVTLSVDPAVSGKPVCLFGATFTGKGRLIRNMATLYGLRVATSNNLNFVIGLPRRGIVENAQDVPVELANLIPPSLLRYLSWEPSFLTRKTFGSDEDSQTPAEKRLSIAKASHNQLYINSGMVTGNSYYLPAVKRLRIFVERAVPGRDAPPVRVKALGPEPERLIALMMLAGPGLQQLSVLRDHSPPACFFDIDDMVVQLSGGSSQSGSNTVKSVRAMFGYMDENGKFQSEFGSNTHTIVGQ